MVVASDNDGECPRHPEKERAPPLAELPLAIARGGQGFERLRPRPRPVEFEDS